MRSLRSRPVGDEAAVGVGVPGAAHRLDGGAGAVEVDGEGDAAAGRAGDRMEAPRVAVDVAQPEALELQLLHDPGPADHDVRARAAVHPVAREAFDGGDGAAEHRVALDDLDVEAGPGEVAGGDQGVVAGADDDDACADPADVADSAHASCFTRTA